MSHFVVDQLILSIYKNKQPNFEYLFLLIRYLHFVCVTQSVPLYLSEMAPAKYRGAFSNGFQLSIGIGALCANMINYGTEKIRGGWGWRISLAMAAVPAAILVVGTLFLPETPNSLIQHGGDKNIARAESTLRKVRGIDNVEKELDDLIAASKASEETADYNQFWRILERKYRPQFVMSIAIPFFQQVCYI